MSAWDWAVRRVALLPWPSPVSASPRETEPLDLKWFVTATKVPAPSTASNSWASGWRASPVKASWLKMRDSPTGATVAGS